MQIKNYNMLILYTVQKSKNKKTKENIPNVGKDAWVASGIQYTIGGSIN